MDGRDDGPPPPSSSPFTLHAPVGINRNGQIEYNSLNMGFEYLDVSVPMHGPSLFLVAAILDLS